MDYIITNKSSGIKLDGNGSPTVCKVENAQHFEYDKARNIFQNMPKPLKNLKFSIKCVNDFQTKAKDNIPTLQTLREANRAANPHAQVKKYIDTVEYDVPKEIQFWVDKIHVCNDLIGCANDRKQELVAMLSNVDKEKSNVEHEIEMIERLNACEGYKQYKTLKDILKKRRVIKDELALVEMILEMKIQNIDVGRIDNFVYGLENRRFKYRKVANL